MSIVVFSSPQGPVPPNYCQVSRWADAREVELWKRVHSHIPNEIGRGAQVYVTLPGTRKPGGTGDYRIDFCVPKLMLAPASKPEWKQIVGNVANTPIYNVVIEKVL